MGRFVEKKNVEKGKIWLLVTSGDLTFDLIYKMTEAIVMIFDTLLIAAYLLSHYMAQEQS